MQLSFSAFNEQTTIPELSIWDLNEKNIPQYDKLLVESGILDFKVPVEYWLSDSSSHALGYMTHNIFRYFGKFPPPVARHLIKNYSFAGDLIIDPMCGSGTTGLETMLLERDAVCCDINPLSVLISKVKVNYIEETVLRKALFEIEKNITEFDNKDLKPSEEKIEKEWFYAETVDSISKIKYAILNTELSQELKDVFMVALLASVRRASKATTQQGRLFKDIETALHDVLPLFLKKSKEIITSISQIPYENKSKVTILNQSANSDLNKNLEGQAKLIICHPPYFNLYKYSSINSLEMSWMDDTNRTDIRKQEIREFFKIGKAENVDKYVEDMAATLIHIKKYIATDGTLALMNGDTIIQNKYIPVNKMLMEKLTEHYAVEKVALRIPKYTEASWAASQRRETDKVGISLCDFVYILKPLKTA